MLYMHKIWYSKFLEQPTCAKSNSVDCLIIIIKSHLIGFNCFFTEEYVNMFVNFIYRHKLGSWGREGEGEGERERERERASIKHGIIITLFQIWHTFVDPKVFIGSGCHGNCSIVGTCGDSNAKIIVPILGGRHKTIITCIMYNITLLMIMWLQ